MNKIIICAAMLVSTAAWAGHYVNGYSRSNGTYVQGHYQSDRDGTVTNNYSYEGNSNPYSGRVGTNRYSHDTTSPNYQGPNAYGQSGHSQNGRSRNGLYGNGLSQRPYGYNNSLGN